jgi:predicted metal-dependent hydrolase
MVELHVRPGPVQREGAILGVSNINSLVRWLKAAALEALTPRAAHFAALLGRPAPRIALSSARTQWGVCTEGGAIRLSWRLVHIEPALADYVVAHETAHLVELNHSRRFWTVVARLYPGWQDARERLELAGAALPIFPRNHP